MAIVSVPINGVGFGHLTRLAIVSRWLRRAGERPVIVYQGKYPPELAARIPGIGTLPLYRLPPETLQFAVEQISSCARLSRPAIIIEDTHPAPVTWPADLTRVLLVRPTTFDYLESLRQQPQQPDAVLMCDAPGSPTWPYTDAQTRMIESWPGWRAVGPIYRRPSAAAVAEVKRRYALDADTPLVVFTMGGGGEQPGAGDRAAFIERSEALAARIRACRPSSRLVFVRGPLFPAHLTLPPIFEDVSTEPDLPALIAAADGAVIRPGFNITWECVAGATPFIALEGKTYSEPVQDRLRGLQRHGVELSDDPETWFDPRWRDSVVSACRALGERFNGVPKEPIIAAVRGSVTQRSAALSAPAVGGRRRWFQGAFTARPAAPALLVRVDDVVEADDTVKWLAAACGERRVPLSFEVIPYYVTLTAAEADALDGDGRIEVSQHGFAHLPGALPERIRGEFYADRRQPSRASVHWLRCGLRLLRRRFGPRFRGGYSAPYDTWPSWLADEWQSAGGAFLSRMRAPDPSEAPMPHVRLSVDPWDWQRRAHHDEHDLTEAANRALDGDAAIGLVLHPQCLIEPEHRARLEDLLDALLMAGCRPRAVSDIALRR